MELVKKFFKMKPIDNWRDNSLNTVRLFAAFSALYMHTKAHLALECPQVLDFLSSLFFCVPIFLTLSGFLIWNSIGNSPSFMSYAKKRFWRIYPEMWAGIAVNLMVLVILFKEKIQWVWLGIFAVTQGTVLQFWTPSFLESYGCGTPNGSLWTICVLMQSYLALYFAYKWLHKRPIWLWVIGLVVSCVVSYVTPYFEPFMPGVIFKLYNQTLFPFFWLFLLGAFVSEYKEKIVPVLKKFWPLFLAISIFFMYGNRDITMAREGYTLFRSIGQFAGFLGLAYALPKLNIKLDISYGIYIYHMTIVNAMIELGFTGKFIYLPIVVVITCVIAYISSLIFGNLAKNKKAKL